MCSGANKASVLRRKMASDCQGEISSVEKPLKSSMEGFHTRTFDSLGKEESYRQPVQEINCQDRAENIENSHQRGAPSGMRL